MPTRDLSRAVRSLAIPFGAALVAFLLWNTLFVWPLKIFVVFLHELSHGVAAIATGGTIERIDLSADQSGLTVTRGGSRFVVASAGYLGSLGFGALFLLLAARSRHDRAIVATLGAIVLVVTLLFVRTPFGFAYGLVAALLLIGVAAKLGAAVSDALLRIVGAVSCLYAVWDIVSDLVVRTVPGSDAWALSQMTGIPSVAWGVLWGIVAIGVIGAVSLKVAKSPGE